MAFINIALLVISNIAKENQSWTQFSGQMTFIFCYFVLMMFITYLCITGMMKPVILIYQRRDQGLYA